MSCLHKNIFHLSILPSKVFRAVQVVLRTIIKDKNSHTSLRETIILPYAPVKKYDPKQVVFITSTFTVVTRPTVP